MPADKSRFGVFDQLGEKSRFAVKRIAHGLAGGRNAAGTEEQKIADLYKSFMDTKGIEARGLQPLAGELALIAGLPNKEALAGAFARAASQGVDTPIGLWVDQDDKNPSAYISGLTQSGLGLPDRDFYFRTGEKAENIRREYTKYVTTLLRLSGEEKAEAKAAAVFALEKSLAQRQWTLVELRDPEKTYNKTAIRDLGSVAPGFDWSGYMRAAGIRPEETDVVVNQPSYLAGFTQVLADQSLESWKLYMKVRTLDAAAPYLPKAYAAASFADNKTLSGQPKMEIRWKRGIALLNKMLGEPVGKIYVRKNFSESSRTRMRQLVENLRAAFRERVLSREWMGEATKQKALEKLGKFLSKIGYPDQWTDYSPLRVDANDLIGNVRRANVFAYGRMIGKLGRPVDRNEWGMSPQTVNGGYSASKNSITFPAAFLLAPFFDPRADDAVNYGAIGAVIGHEMTHGFDDEGAQFDGEGNLKSWWTPEDLAAFQSRTGKLAAQYDAFEPLPGQHINGNLTLGENIADLGGLTIAHRAYQLALNGAAATIIDGLTGPQRFFMSWAQGLRAAIRDEKMENMLATDPHSPTQFRVNGVVRNMPEFYEAFGVKTGDKLHLPEQDRVEIW
jgi:predicted metalloendopeptidase